MESNGTLNFIIYYRNKRVFNDIVDTWVEKTPLKSVCAIICDEESKEEETMSDLYLKQTGGEFKRPKKKVCVVHHEPLPKTYFDSDDSVFI